MNTYKTMPQLEPEERSALRDFLLTHFNLSELKDLAFDLSVNHEELSHDTASSFCRELIWYFERRDRLSCLLVEIMRRRDGTSITQLLEKLPPCKPNKRVQIIINTEDIEDQEELLNKLSEVLNITREEIRLIGVLRGSIKLLIELPEDAADLLINSDIREFADGKYQIVSIEEFESLSDDDKYRWTESYNSRSSGNVAKQEPLLPISDEASTTSSRIPSTSQAENATRLQNLTIEILERECRERSQADSRETIDYCFELFRRAIEMNDEAAWDTIFRIYNPLVARWTNSANSIEGLVQDAWSRFTHTLNKTAIDNFKHTNQILSYLKKCAISAKMDNNRKIHSHKDINFIRTVLELNIDETDNNKIEAIVANILDAFDEQHRLVFHLCVEEGLNSSDVANLHPEIFASVSDVERVRLRILMRLRRALIDFS